MLQMNLRTLVVLVPVPYKPGVVDNVWVVDDGMWDNSAKYEMVHNIGKYRMTMRD